MILSLLSVQLDIHYSIYQLGADRKVEAIIWLLQMVFHPDGVGKGESSGNIIIPLLRSPSPIAPFIKTGREDLNSL